MKWTSLNELREKYLSFFESKGHLRLPSFPLVPQGDKSLLLINSLDRSNLFSDIIFKNIRQALTETLRGALPRSAVQNVHCAPYKQGEGKASQERVPNRETE